MNRGATIMDDFYAALSWVGHSLSIASVLGALFGWFPHVAALVAFIWYSIQIYESATVQTWLRNRRMRRLAKLQHQLDVLQATEHLGERKHHK